MNRRPAQSNDSAEIVSWFPTRNDVVVWGGPKIPDPLTSDWLAEEFEKSRHWVWADENGALCGVFCLLPKDAGVHLTRFAVAPNMRGRGLARPMVQEIIFVAQLSGARQLTLRVYGSNAKARHLYDDAGFQIVEERVVEEDASGVSHDMMLALNCEGKDGAQG